MIAWHDHSSDRDRAALGRADPRAVRALAYASDAGMPMISDPGFTLMRDIAAAGLYATVLPGAPRP